MTAKRKRVWIPEAPMINLRRYVEIGAVGHSVGFEGYFDVELIHARTGLVKKKLQFRNVIVDAGLAHLAARNRWTDIVDYLAVGTGSTPPSVSDTTLVAEIARTDNDGGFSNETYTQGSGDQTEYHAQIITRVFTESEANGNLTELGFFNQSIGGTMWNRQLFRDELGNPTTITKTDEDQLRVRYELRLTPPFDDHIQEFTVKGVDITATCRAANVTNSTYWGIGIGAVASSTIMYAYDADGAGPRSGVPSGAQQSQTSHTIQPYVPGTHYTEIERVFGPSRANFGQGVGATRTAVWDSRWPVFQAGFSPRIPKLDSERLVIMERLTYGRV